MHANMHLKMPKYALKNTNMYKSKQKKHKKMKILIIFDTNVMEVHNALSYQVFKIKHFFN